MSNVHLRTIGNPPASDPAAGLPGIVPAEPTVAVCGCGRSFACGAATGHCWCFERPAVLPVPAAGGGIGCLCPMCLAAVLSPGSAGGT